MNQNRQENEKQLRTISVLMLLSAVFSAIAAGASAYVAWERFKYDFPKYSYRTFHGELQITQVRGRWRANVGEVYLHSCIFNPDPEKSGVFTRFIYDGLPLVVFNKTLGSRDYDTDGMKETLVGMGCSYESASNTVLVMFHNGREIRLKWPFSRPLVQ